MKYISINELPAAIRSYCERTGISQTALAKKLGTVQQNVNNWCCGRTLPSLEKYEKLLHIMEGEEQ